VQVVPDGPWDCSKMEPGATCASSANLWRDDVAPPAPLTRPKLSKRAAGMQRVRTKMRPKEGKPRAVGRRSVARKWHAAEALYLPDALATQPRLAAVDPITVRGLRDM
jgi:hypothetical protein